MLEEDEGEYEMVVEAVGVRQLEVGLIEVPLDDLVAHLRDALCL